MRQARMLLMTILAGCAGEPLPPTEVPATAQWDEASAQEARAAVGKLVQAFVTMDLDGLRGALAEDGVVATYELDLEGKPTRLGSRDEVIRYGEAMFAEMQKMGGRLHVFQHSIDCRATSTIAYCAMEYDFSATMPDGTTMTQPSRTSFVLRKGGGAWKLTSWHTSLSKLPAAPTAAPAAPVPPALALAPVEYDLKALQLADVPEVRGVKGALLWQDPTSGESATVTRFPKGAQFPPHFHNHGLHVYVIKGTFSWTEQNGTVHEVKAGGYTYQPGKQVHTTASKDGCTFLQINEGTFDLVPVDEKGNPQPAMAPTWPAAQK